MAIFAITAGVLLVRIGYAAGVLCDAEKHQEIEKMYVVQLLDRYIHK
jgi:hypothetical protein